MKKIKNVKGQSIVGMLIAVCLIMMLIGFMLDFLKPKYNEIDIVEKVPIRALTDNSEIKGEINGALTFIDGEISENMVYRVEAVNDNTKLVQALKFEVEEIEKYMDLEEGETPYLKFKITKYDFEEENPNMSSLVQNYIPSKYKGLFSEEIVGKINSISIHVSEESISNYVQIDTK